MKTQRVTLLISPEDKRRFKSLAEDRGMTMSEFARQAMHAQGVSSIDDTRELAALTAELREAIPAMRKGLRSANASVTRVLASIAERHKGGR